MVLPINLTSPPPSSPVISRDNPISGENNNNGGASSPTSQPENVNRPHSAQHCPSWLSGKQNSNVPSSPSSEVDTESPSGEQKKIKSQNLQSKLAVENSVKFSHGSISREQQADALAQIEKSYEHASPSQKSEILDKLTAALCSNSNHSSAARNNIDSKLMKRYMELCEKITEASNDFPSKRREMIEENLQWACHGQEENEIYLSQLSTILSSLSPPAKWKVTDFAKNLLAVKKERLKDAKVQGTSVPYSFRRTYNCDFLKAECKNVSELTLAYLTAALNGPPTEAYAADIALEEFHRTGWTEKQCMEYLKSMSVYWKSAGETSDNGLLAFFRGLSPGYPRVLKSEDETSDNGQLAFSRGLSPGYLRDIASPVGGWGNFLGRLFFGGNGRLRLGADAKDLVSFLDKMVRDGKPNELIQGLNDFDAPASGKSSEGRLAAAIASQPDVADKVREALMASMASIPSDWNSPLYADQKRHLKTFFQYATTLDKDSEKLMADYCIKTNRYLILNAMLGADASEKSAKNDFQKFITEIQSSRPMPPNMEAELAVANSVAFSIGATPSERQNDALTQIKNAYDQATPEQKEAMLKNLKTGLNFWPGTEWPRNEFDPEVKSRYQGVCEKFSNPAPASSLASVDGNN